MIVADASPLIALARIGQLDLLERMYDTVAIPRAVEEEIKRHPRGFEGERPAWVVGHEVQNRTAVAELMPELDWGEAEAVVLAVQLGTRLVIDEEAGRRVARRWGLAVTGTLGTLLTAKRAGHIDLLTPMLAKLEAEGFHMSAQLMADLRSMAGEE